MSRRIAARRVIVVARRELFATVTRPAFLVTLLAMPLLMAAIAVLPAIGIALSGGPAAVLGIDARAVTVVGIVDGTGRGLALDEPIAWHNADQRAAELEARRKRAEGSSLEDRLPDFLKDPAFVDSADRGGFDGDWRIELRRFADASSAREAVLAGEAAAAYVLGAPWVQDASVDVLVPPRGPMNPGVFPGQRAVARLLRFALAGSGVDPVDRSRLVHVLEPVAQEVFASGGPERRSPQGLDQGISMILPLLFASFFSLSIFVASGYLLDGISEEKESRILEVLLASLTPEELLAGKILGLGAAGLLQTSVLVLAGLIPLLALGLSSLGGPTIAAMTLCAILGYAEYAAVMAASGAVASNRQEGRQISAVFTLTAASPMFLLPVFLAAPDGPVATALSLLPPTAPIAMILRLGLCSVPAWQQGAATFGMALSAWASWRVGSRVFRVAILMTGARPPLRRIWEWARGA